MVALAPPAVSTLTRASLWGLALILAACPPPSGPQQPSDAGSNVVGDAGPWNPPADAGFDDAGQPVVDAGPVNTVTIVERITPPTGAMAGGYRVTIAGDGLTAGARVFFGDAEGDLVTAAGLPRAIRVRVPPAAAPGPVTVRVVTEIGVGELLGGFTYFSPLELTGVNPADGSTEGGTSVTVRGQGLHEDMVVTVGGRQVVGLAVADDGASATFRTPPGDVGRADVMAVDGFGRSVLELAFTYHGALRLDAVVPAAVEDAAGDGGEVVELRGAGFSDLGGAATQVTIGGAVAARQNLISDARLRVLLPDGLEGLQDVAVERGADRAQLDNALAVVPATSGVFGVLAAVPPRADVGGGAVITLAGEGLSAVTAVRVGGLAASDITVLDDRRVTFVAPAGPAPGTAAIEVERADSERATLADFAWVSTPVLTRIVPAEGPAAGGTELVLEGRGLSGITSVTLGGVPADFTVESDTRVLVTSPAGAPGPVDVVVRAGATRGALENGYRYDAPLDVVGVRPARGAVGGDTFVTITGSGFSRAPVTVLFGETPALPLELTVVNDTTLTARTPPHLPGLVEVSVMQGDDRATVESAFTYFDAASIVGGARGGSIEGAVYVTALDGQLGLPIPGLVAFVGTDGTPVAAGITNMLGQATISGPDVVGPQTVTVAGDCFSTATFVDVNASELSVFLFPLCSSGPPGSGPAPPPPPPATIRGRVFGFAKEFFDPAALDQSGCSQSAATPPAQRLPCEIAFAEVRTTARDEFSGAVFPGGDNVVFEEGGEFFIAQSRPGRLALVALAGIFDINNDTFRLRQLGVRREVFPQFGVNLEDQDVELTIPLDEEVNVSLPDAPLRLDETQVGFAPTITRVVPFLQFGGEGAYNYTQAVEGKRNHRLTEMPQLPGEMLTFFAGAYTTDGFNRISSAGSVSLVQGQRYVTGQGTASEWGQTDFTGRPLVTGAIFVTDRPDGTRFASAILGSPDPTTIQLQEAPDFSATGRTYHIGNPGAPLSEVRQDGVGDLRGGVSIQPVLGIPEPISPVQNGVLTDRTLRWKAPNGQQPSLHTMYVYDAIAVSTIWEIMADGARTKVIIPRIPTREAILASLPLAQRACLQDPSTSAACGFYGDLEGFVPPSDMAQGGLAWLHQSVFTPGLEFNNWSLLETGGRGSRSRTQSLHVFVRGAD